MGLPLQHVTGLVPWMQGVIQTWDTLVYLSNFSKTKTKMADLQRNVASVVNSWML